MGLFDEIHDEKLDDLPGTKIQFVGNPWRVIGVTVAKRGKVLVLPIGEDSDGSTIWLTLEKVEEKN